jgi:hypothetical protein
MSISKFDMGPSVTLSMTQEMLSLLMRTARGNYHATEEEAKALINFQELADQTLTYCAEHPENKGVVHGFCL